ncbi:MAG: substrate-binding domain-containing protein [Ruminococcus sp.]|nr:substrate-binding domain-containing protein [Ruminococcus sp.]
MKERPTIGIITAQAADPEQHQLLSGIIGQAQQLGLDTAVFSNIYNSAEYFADVQVENRIYDLILSKRLDGLILSAESFLNADLQQEIYQRIMQRTDIPLIVTGAEIEGLDCINTDVRADAEAITAHLIEVHGFTNIDYLTGQEGNETSEERINGYRDALSGHGLVFDPKNVIYGDFWYNSGHALADEYIKGTRRLPQAVACANDYMAYGLCDRLMENGIKVPEDVSVIGYEYVGGRHLHTPIITTYRRNRRGLGARAVVMLYNKMNGTSKPLPSISGELIPGNSCSCGADTKQLCSELAVVRREQQYSTLNLVGNFEQQLSTCRSVSGFVHVLQEFVYLVRDVRGVYMCLFDNWCSSSGNPAPSTDLDAPMLCYSVMTPTNSDIGPVIFRMAEEFAPSVTSITDSGLALYFCPIFFSGRYFGYFVLQYGNADGYDMILRDWLKIASNGLELLRMKNDISTLLECRDLSVLHDSATGLYNNDGMSSELRALIKSDPDARNIAAVLVRTDIFSEGVSINDQGRVIAEDRAVADILRSFTGSGSECCGKVADRTYLMLCVGNSSEESTALLADKVSTLVSHKRSCNPSEIVTEFALYPVADADFENISAELQTRANDIVYKLSLLRRNASFEGYDEIRARIYSSPTEDLRAEKLCRTLGHSAGYFRAMYKELFGLSFHQDLIRSRISYAKLLILTDNSSFASIASRCGYNDEKHFYHQFRQITGLSPKQYRAG